MHPAATGPLAPASPSRLASWHGLETRLDRWASVGAFAFGLAAASVALVVF